MLVSIYIYQWYMTNPVSPHPCQHLMLSLFWILAVLVCVCVCSESSPRLSLYLCKPLWFSRFILKWSCFLAFTGSWWTEYSRLIRMPSTSCQSPSNSTETSSFIPRKPSFLPLSQESWDLPLNLHFLLFASFLYPMINGEPQKVPEWVSSTLRDAL